MYYDLLTKKWHKFEVRGARFWSDPDGYGHDVISIQSVNWTLTSGTCSLTLNADNVVEWLILEDNPNIELLYENS